MSKHDDKLEQKSPAKPEICTKEGELCDEQLNEVSGGIVVTKQMDNASTKLWREA
jgi:hypothetical protein